MVMTEQVRPRRSVSGIGLAGVVMLAGWIVTPALSAGGSHDKEDKGGKTAPADQQVEVVVTTSDDESGKPKIRIFKSGSSDKEGAHVFSMPDSLMEFVTPEFSFGGRDLAFVFRDDDEESDEDHGRGHAGDGDLHARLERLERRLDELARALHGGGGPMARPDGMHGSAGGEAHVFEWHRAVPGHEQEGQPGAAPSVEIRRERRGAAPPQPPAPPAAPGRWFGAPGDRDEDSGEVMVETYALPEGKLKALFELMVRNDVPIPVAQRDGAIEVHGTRGQQRIMRAFIEMIHPQEHSQGAAPDMLMWMRAPSADSRSIAIARGRAPTGRRAADGVREMTQRLRAQARELAGQKRTMESQADRLRKQAEELERRAEELREKAESLADMEPENDKQREKQERERTSLREMSEQVETQVEELTSAADRIELQAEHAERQLDELTEHAEELQEVARRAAQAVTRAERAGAIEYATDLADRLARVADASDLVARLCEAGRGAALIAELDGAIDPRFDDEELSYTDEDASETVELNTMPAAALRPAAPAAPAAAAAPVGVTHPAQPAAPAAGAPAAEPSPGK